MAAKGKNQVVLKEIMEFAEYLGMDPVEDGDLLWIAEQARNAPLPAPWSEHQDEGGNTYYYNSATQEVVWDKPANYVMAADDELMMACIKIWNNFKLGPSGL